MEYKIRDGDVYAYREKHREVFVDQFVEFREEDTPTGREIKQQFLTTGEDIKLVMRIGDIKKLFNNEQQL
jgi:hypothetical protein